MLLSLLLTTVTLAASPEVEACMEAQESGSYELWAAYLQRYPGGSCAGTPAAIDARDCAQARRLDTEGAWHLYIAEHPGGLCIDHALDQLPVSEEAAPALSSFDSLERADLVTVEAPVVLGALAEAAVVQVLEAARPELGRCLSEARVLNPDLEGRIEVRFHVNGEGWVSRGRVRASSLGHGGVEGCVVRVLEDQRFCPPEGKAVVTVGLRLRP